MKRLDTLLNKQEKRICGVMSGTSLDGVDVAVIHVQGHGIQTKFTCEAFDTVPYDEPTRDELLHIQKSGTLDDIARGNIALGFVFADAIKSVCTKSKIALGTIDLIGLHGQTIWHSPEKKKQFGYNANGTLQIGDPSVVAKQCGVITIGDFRVGDCALGGEGAPLIPYVDYILLHSEKTHRALLNVGGIANISVLPTGCTPDDIIGFDTGPGNMIVDALCKKYFSVAYDKDGHYARKGSISLPLLSWMLQHEYIMRHPPKSTGREMFGAAFVEELCKIAEADKLSPESIIATATEFTAQCVHINFGMFVKHTADISELIVSGGGAHNGFLMEQLANLFTPIRVLTSDQYGVPVDAKEAIGFALLANETINEQPANIPHVTGASQRAILGKICL
ncbi:MAG TPA: anhydro-N-acetylmuramic acid kinase [Candidatus Kapabacteria bacterium]|nr:anhydro-N-acetylmuramic acid kinase [Candidatus Kapabacteria bacterium]